MPELTAAGDDPGQQFRLVLEKVNDVTLARPLYASLSLSFSPANDDAFRDHPLSLALRSPKNSIVPSRPRNRPAASTLPDSSEMRGDGLCLSLDSRAARYLTARR